MVRSTYQAAMKNPVVAHDLTPAEQTRMQEHKETRETIAGDRFWLKRPDGIAFACRERESECACVEKERASVCV